ncbi:glutamate-cysteine ligase family protein [Legionella sp. W05-934-2]|uniref:glutamate-cysteine ligase family protein n=1 Tax=Legionella sp. W05-934-2 TaxID=1198649 RepID=UPI003462E1E1
MGQEISSSTFCRSDFEQFEQRLKRETDILSNWFAEDVFDCNPLQIGVELEGWLIDKHGFPASKSEPMIAAVNDKNVVPELAKYNFEINTKAISLGHFCLDELYQDLKQVWQRCCNEANQLDVSAIAIGILPTVQQSMLVAENMYPCQRYYALEEEINFYRKGQPVMAEIQGIDHFQTSFYGLLLESVNTSLQIHVQICLADSVRMYNASQIIAAPMVAVSANSPYLFGNNLWCETRIPIFEQSTAIPHSKNGSQATYKRATFGQQFVASSLMELFSENLHDNLILLPELSNEPEEQLHHLRLQNGTIWRWNRPLVGMDNPAKPNLRIEHRVNPAGPSMIDSIANVALFLGLLNYYARKEVPPETEITFETTASNFYRAAKDGLDCDLMWLNQKQIDITTLLLEELIPNAKIGLKTLDFDQELIDYYLTIIEERVKRRLTGSQWQRKFIAKYGRDFNNMVYFYLDNQTQEIPVYQWNI